MVRAIKRKVVGLLLIVIDYLRLVPGTEDIVLKLELITGALGGVAVAHAAEKRELTKEKLLLISSTLSIIIALAPFVPGLQPFLPYLIKIASTLSTLRLGVGIVSKTTKDIDAEKQDADNATK